jgi:hypothetical protein
LVEEHLRVFLGCPLISQGPVGYAPANWAARFQLSGIPDAASLSRTPLTREELYGICQTRPLLFSYVCVMAWGLQGAVPGSGRHVKSAWSHRHEITERLQFIRAENQKLEQAYNLFCAPNSIAGMGPSYFSKLLHFFGAARAMPIMDQWTARSVNLIAGRSVVRMAGKYPSPLNRGLEYADFVRTMQRIADRAASAWNTECAPLWQVEEQLFARGGKNPSPWRAYVRSWSA